MSVRLWKAEAVSMLVSGCLYACGRLVGDLGLRKAFKGSRMSIFSWTV